MNEGGTETSTKKLDMKFVFLFIHDYFLQELFIFSNKI